MPQFNNEKQKSTFADLLRAGRVLPVISQKAVVDLLLGGHSEMVESYANINGYPLPDKDDLLKMIKYVGVDNGLSQERLKRDYVSFVKKHILGLARKSGTLDEDTLKDAAEGIYDVKLTEFAGSLGYPRFRDPSEDPFLMLAHLPLPIYLTTCQHTFLEQALLRAKKKPRSEVCRWYVDVDVGQKESVSSDSDYVPTKEEPLVYHLFGLDEDPLSLVLTEDDHIEFLVAMGRANANPIPSEIRAKLSTLFVVFLGFDLPSWDFRTLFWGLIKQTDGKSEGAVTLQLKYSEEEKRYLESYLQKEASLKIEWEELPEYVRGLRALRAGE